MNLKKLLFVAGVATLFAPVSAFADCSPACASGEVCRYEAAGGKFYCAPSKTARGPAAVSGPRATPATGSPRVAASSRSAAPKKSSGNKLGNFEIQDVKSPRDSASGQATGRRTHKP